jgi:hypothetical protein
MVSNEAWMGSGTSITMAPESELFLGYMPYGPTLGRANTNKAHLIKYSLGYTIDGSDVQIEDAHGEGSSVGGAYASGAVGHFTDYYHLVPDLYTGCIAKFYYTEDSSVAATLQFTAIVAGNDADAIYFAGNLNDFPQLFADEDAAVDSTNTRGYIILSQQGSIVPAPISLEKRNSASVTQSAGGQTSQITANDGTCATIKLRDLVYKSDGTFIGKVWSGLTSGSLSGTQTEPSSSTTYIHYKSGQITTVNGTPSVSNGIGSMVGNASVTGIFTAGDDISTHASSGTSATFLGKVITISSDGLTITFARSGGVALPSNTHQIHWGKDIPASSGNLDIYIPYPRILSDNWVGLTNTITPPNADVEMKQLGLSMMGSRNFSYQYKGMETASNASIDANLNHGTWLHYALGSTALTLPSTTGTDNATKFNAKTAMATTHETWVSMKGAAVAGLSSGPFFHRVLRGTNALCPPVLPGYVAEKLSNNPSMNSDTGQAENTFTYTFSERNDASLPSFALELVTQKGSKLANAPMVDRNTYNEECYAQVYPGCVVNSFTLSANENEEVKATLDLNVKRVFEAPDGYMGRAYDSTEVVTGVLNNPTNDFKNLYNFGQLTGDGGTNASGTIVKEFMTPFFFSDGTISLFGQEFLKVSSFSLSLNNSVTDKRYIGNYDKQIKMSVPGQRTYEITMSALVTDRRLFDELRKEESTRSVLTSDSVIQLLLAKDNGEQIKLQFDDFMVSTNSWPIPEDKGPVYVDFTIVPLATQTISAISHWVMQG